MSLTGFVKRLNTMGTRYQVATIGDIPPGSGKELVAGERLLAVFNVDGTFWAMDGVCPHAGGPLGKGMLRGCVITCPWHGWQFDVTTGQHRLNPRIQHATFPVTLEGEAVYVEIPNP